LPKTRMKVSFLFAPSSEATAQQGVQLLTINFCQSTKSLPSESRSSIPRLIWKYLSAR